MSDFESRVREALGTGAERAPLPVGLADGARRRLKRRRVVTSAVVATAAVLAAVPVGIALLGDDGGSGSRDRDENVVASELPDIPDGWRWVSWHDVQLAVPGQWQEGAISQWCLGGDQDAGAIDDGAGFSTQVACSPAVGYGVRFVPGEAKEPLVDHRGVAERLAVGGNTVDVVAADRATLDTILDTVNRFAEADSRGCTSVFDADSVMSPEGEYVALPDEGVVSVCQYTGSKVDGRTTYDLTGSATLSGEDSAQLLAGIAAAPSTSSAECSSGPNGEEPPFFAVAFEVRTADGRVAASTAATCEGTPLRTAEGEFDGSELMTASSGGGGSAVSEPEISQE